MPIDIKQLNQSELSGFVSGNLGATYRTVMGNNIVYTDETNQTISGFKTFRNPPNVPYAGTTGQVVSQRYVADKINLASGTLDTKINNVSGQTFFIFRGGFVTGDVYNNKDSIRYNGSTYGYTGTSSFTGSSPSGTDWNLLASSGTSGYSGYSGDSGYSGYSGYSGSPGSGFFFINNGTVTGSFFDTNFFIDIPYTGLNIMESFVSHSGALTGYALGCHSMGTSGGPLSGSIYFRDTANVKSITQGFSMNTGEVFKTGLFDLVANFDPLDRVGIEIYSGISGMQGLTIGLFGVEWGI